MKISLDPIERDLLLRIQETAVLASSLIKGDDNLTLEGTADQLDDLRNGVSDALLRIGFDGFYKPTAEGGVLENLIDKLFMG